MLYLPYPFCLSTPSIPYSLSINALPSLSLLSINTFHSLFLVCQCSTFLIPSVYQHLPFSVPCLSMLYLPYPFCLSTPSVPCSLSINALPSLSLLSINTFPSLPLLSINASHLLSLSTIVSLPYSFYLPMNPFSFHLVYYCLPSLCICLSMPSPFLQSIDARLSHSLSINAFLSYSFYLSMPPLPFPSIHQYKILTILVRHLCSSCCQKSNISQL